MTRPKQFSYDAVVAGHICLDVIPKLRKSYDTINQIFLPGRTTNVDAAAISTGGPVSNTGIALRRQGLKVAFMSRIGDDEFGKIILQRLQKEGDIEGVKIIPGASSSYTIAIAPPGIDRMFLHHEGTNNTFASEDINFDIVQQAPLFHLGYPPLMRRLYEDNGDELLSIYQKARAAGAITSLDLVFPDRDTPSGQVDWYSILARVLPYVDIFQPSIEEIFFMIEKTNFLALQDQYGSAKMIDYLSGADFTRISDQLLSLGARLIAIKSGHRGIYFRSGDRHSLASLLPALPGSQERWIGRELLCPAYRADTIASATGSGDSAIAGFLTAFRRQLPIEDCLHHANMLGYQNLQALDALSGIKTWPETVRMIETGVPPISLLPLTGADWHWQPELQVHLGPNDRFR